MSKMAEWSHMKLVMCNGNMDLHANAREKFSYIRAPDTKFPWCTVCVIEYDPMTMLSEYAAGEIVESEGKLHYPVIWAAGVSLYKKEPGYDFDRLIGWKFAFGRALKAVRVLLENFTLETTSYGGLACYLQPGVTKEELDLAKEEEDELNIPPAWSALFSAGLTDVMNPGRVGFPLWLSVPKSVACRIYPDSGSGCNPTVDAVRDPHLLLMLYGTIIRVMGKRAKNWKY